MPKYRCTVTIDFPADDDDAARNRVCQHFIANEHLFGNIGFEGAIKKKLIKFSKQKNLLDKADRVRPIRIS